MECREFLNHIPEFIVEDMDLQYTSDFLRHMKNCKECRGELELSYIIQKSMEAIDSSSYTSYNFQQQLENRMKTYEEKANVYDKFQVGFKICRWLAFFMIICMFILYLVV